MKTIKVYYDKPFILEYWFQGKVVAREQHIWKGANVETPMDKTKSIITKPIVDIELIEII